MGTIDSPPWIDANRRRLPKGVFGNELPKPFVQTLWAEEFPFGWGNVGFGTTGDMVHADSPARSFASSAIGFFDEVSGNDDTVKQFGPKA